MLKKEYLEDLNQAIDELEKTHPDLKRNMDVDKYEKEKREALLVNYCSKEELFVQIAKIYANVNDSHTSIRDCFSDRLKLKLLYENGKMYIINHKYEYDFLYNEIKSINGVKIKEIITKFEEFLPKENNEQKSCNLETMFTNVSFLNGLNIVKENCLIETDTGKYNLVEAKEKSEWKISMIDHEAKWIDNKNYYFKYGFCGPDKETVDKIINRTKEELCSNIAKRIIIDLRGNVGGNSELIESFVMFLEKYKKDYDVKVICLIDKKVFSSGIFAAMAFKKIGAIFIGEKTSGTINHFGYPKRIKLKNSGYLLGISQVEWIYENGEYISSKRKYKKDQIMKRQVVPDVEIIETIYDIKENKDKMLEISCKT